MTAVTLAPARSVRPLFVATVFLGSFLLFLIQPMVARLVLPSLGGSPNVWNTAMLFYQAALLIGYLYAHGLARLPVRTQWAVHLMLFAAAAFTLPIGLAGWWPEAEGGAATWWLLGLLSVSIGPVFVAVASQAPLMQAWFARSGDPDAASPYFLYSASNAGSLLGLVAYPFVLEPMTRLPTQTAFWSAGFAGLIALVALAGWSVWRAQPADTAVPVMPAAAEDEPLTWGRRLWWVALAAVPSGLMLSTTTHITTDIMAMPLLWVLPLGLYLISFIIVFSRFGESWTQMALQLAPISLLFFGAAGLFAIGKLATFYGLASLILLLLVAIALHGTLAAARPAASRLTEYYLWMSLGGMLGGVFCALVAPQLFDWSYEHPILLLAAAALVPALPLTPRIGRMAANLPNWVLAAGALLSAGLAWFVASEIEVRGAARYDWIVAAIAIIGLQAVLTTTRRPAFVWHLAMLMLAMGGWKQLDTSTTDARERSFFGIYTVQDAPESRTRRLLHGTTLHGVQSLDPAKALVPTSYYAPESGVGLAMRAVPALFGANANVAYVGLGTGTLSCYAQPGQRWTVYEIDPVIVRMAFDPKRFSFVTRCKPDLQVKLGDARLELAKAQPGSYDLLAVDAFSSDAIPLHLLTTEAFQVYKRALAEDGLLLVHVSNRYLELNPVVAAIARQNGWTARELVYRPSAQDVADGYSHSISDWIVLTRTPERMRQFMAQVPSPSAWTELKPDPEVSAWSDDYASILPTLKPVRFPK